MFLVLFTVILFFQESFPLRIVRMSVPSYRVRGQSAELICDFKLDGNQLYSVKWYRDQEEFYRYMPRHHPPKHYYKLEGIKVDMSKSDERKVTLQHVTLKSSGIYRCEVSAEKPNFISAAGEGSMEVIYLPRDSPRVTGYEKEYRKGDFLFLNCTSARSYPAAVLSWYIDGRKVQDESMLQRYPATMHAHGLFSVTLGLRVSLGHPTEVRCVSRVAPGWSDESDAVSVDSHLADVKEAVVNVHSSCSETTQSVILLTISVLYLWTARES